MQVVCIGAGTPNRLCKLADEGALRLGRLRHVVLDLQLDAKQRCGPSSAHVLSCAAGVLKCVGWAQGGPGLRQSGFTGSCPSTDVRWHTPRTRRPAVAAGAAAKRSATAAALHEGCTSQCVAQICL
jgi:hypothetical protein